MVSSNLKNSEPERQLGCLIQKMCDLDKMIRNS